jgi:predicted nucleotidyltransferase
LLAHPDFVLRFDADLRSPGLRIPLTADPALFAEAAILGQRVIWLHTFGERFADATDGRGIGPPRLPPERRPRVPKEGAIPTDADGMPDSIGYDAGQQRLLVGRGFIEPVPPAVWHYEVSGKQVLVRWFSYRRKNRERPMIGDRRPPSPLGDIQPDTWLAEYTTGWTRSGWLRHDPAMTREELLALLAQHKPVLKERFGVKSLKLFGSFARGTARDDSDVDVLVEFDEAPSLNALFGAQFYIEDLLGRSVDLVTESALRLEFRPYVERDAIAIA